jgi:hypothetical protein
VFGEARERFAFEIRGLALVEERLSFYIRPADGLQLPAIMQWVKQTFAVRFNLSTDRTGHVWGDRYWSQVLAGEPTEEAKEVDWAAVDVAAETGVLSFGTCPPDGVSPRRQKTRQKPVFTPDPPPDPPSARRSAHIWPKPRGITSINFLHNAVRVTTTGEIRPILKFGGFSKSKGRCLAVKHFSTCIIAIRLLL